MGNKNNKQEQKKDDEKKENLEIVKEASTEEIENIKELFERNPDIFLELVSTSRSIEIRKTHSGPIPDPETLKQYKQIDKNAPDIIFGMAQKEQSFRHMSTYFGQFSALLIGIGGLGVTAYLGVNNQPWLAGIIGFGSLGSLVGVFLHKNREGNKTKPQS